MLAMLLRAHVESGKLDELVEFLRWDAEVARVREPVTIRFDVFKDGENDNPSCKRLTKMRRPSTITISRPHSRSSEISASTALDKFLGIRMDMDIGSAVDDLQRTAVNVNMAHQDSHLPSNTLDCLAGR